MQQEEIIPNELNYQEGSVEQTVIKEKNRSHKFLYIVVGIVFILIIFYSGLLIWHSKQELSVELNHDPSGTFSTEKTESVINTIETENWSTYYSEIYDISFKYPKGWIVEEGKINHLGYESKDVIPCGETWKKYFKSQYTCENEAEDAPYLEIYKFEENSGAQTNGIEFSVMQHDQKLSSEIFELSENNITIGEQILLQTDFSGNSTPAYNKGFQVIGINTGKNSIFSKLNAFAYSRPSSPEYSEIETLKKILNSLNH